MKLLPVTASDEELLDAVRRWVDIVARGDFQGAVDYLQPATPGSGLQPWTASSLETYIANYGWWDPLEDGRVVRITPVGTAGGDLAPQHEVIRPDGRPPMIDFDVPLDGEWSDLTAQFDVVAVDGGWSLALRDLHVL